MISAIQACHENGFAHLDLKPENLMLDMDYNLKLIDFGFSAPIKGYKQEKLMGTPAYMAPELLENKINNP